MKVQIIILIALIFLVSCKNSPPDGKYIIYSTKPTDYRSNYFYSEKKSSDLANYLKGREFDFQFSKNLVILSGYDSKKITFEIDKGYDIPTIKSKNFLSVPDINGYNHSMHLKYGDEEEPEILKIRLRVARNNQFRDTSLVSNDDHQFAEVDLKLKNLNN